MRDPPHRRPVNLPGWNDRAAVALLVLVAGHLHAAETAAGTGSLTPERLIRFVAAHDLPALVAACEESPSAPIRSAAAGCAASSAPVRPASMSVSSPASPSPWPTPSFASTSPVPPPAPASTSSRRTQRDGDRRRRRSDVSSPPGTKPRCGTPRGDGAHGTDQVTRARDRGARPRSRSIVDGEGGAAARRRRPLRCCSSCRVLSSVSALSPPGPRR